MPSDTTRLPNLRSSGATGGTDADALTRGPTAPAASGSDASAFPDAAIEADALTRAPAASNPAASAPANSASDPATSSLSGATLGVDGDTHALPPPAGAKRRFHHYEVCLREDGSSLFELGRGAMGVSYKARDVNLDTFVAIKVISAGLLDQVYAHARERFRREARLAAQLRHPNVASVFHFGETPAGECFYAMEFIEGETLAEKVRREGPLPASLVMEIALQVTFALMAADERGLVHRDLKPANIMLVAAPRGRQPSSSSSSLASSASGLLVKVIDFGLAKAAAGGSSSAASSYDHDAPLTQEGGFLGTPAYASPEQAEGGEVDARSDIYSLGVTLWYLLTGKVPFAGRSLSEIYDRQLHRPLPVAQLIDTQVRAPLIELLKRMLAANSADRPASPAELREALEHCRLAIGDSPALPPSQEYARVLNDKRGWRRGTIIALCAALALLLLAGIGAGAFFLLRRADLAAASPPAKKGGAGAAPVAVAPEKSIAVLPLENLSGGDNADAYFADGIQDDLLSSLSKIKDLKVISRSSVMGYRNTAARNLRDIGQQLGVATILEGSVRRAPDRVLVNVALIDTASGQQIWSDRYDRTLADSLTLQGEVATEIAAALRATLSPEEKARVEIKPTDNPDAYVLYLRARQYQTRPFSLLQDFQTAERFYRQALALDPNFSLAHARLSATLAFNYLTFQPTAELRDEARAEAEAALRLQPDSGEAHLARALCHYWTEKNYDAALRELDIVAKLLPNSAEVDLFSGAIRRRQGRWPQALASLRRALVGDPRSAQTAREIMITDCFLRDWPAAQRDCARAVALAPENSMLQVEYTCVDYWSRGQLAPLRAALAAIPMTEDPDGQTTFFRWDTALLAKDYSAAEHAVTVCPLENVVTTFGAVLPKSYLLGCIALARGDAARAKPLFESARPVMEAESRNYPLDAFRQAYLGLLYAYLGRKEDALRQGNRAVELLPESKDACAGPIPAGLLAMICARAGQPEQALALVERLLKTPAALSPICDGSITRSDLRLRWQWDPLRHDARFQQFFDGPEWKTVYR